MSENTTHPDDVGAPPASFEAAPDTEQAAEPGLELVKTEINGDHGREHHWFTIPAGHKVEDYRAEIDAFIESRAITLDDISITTA